MLSFDELTAGQGTLAFFVSIMSNIKSMKNHTNTTGTTSTERTQNVLDLLMEQGVITDIENISGACDTISIGLHELSDRGASPQELQSVSGAAARTDMAVRALLNRITNIVFTVKVREV